MIQAILFVGLLLAITVKVATGAWIWTFAVILAIILLLITAEYIVVQLKG